MLMLPLHYFFQPIADCPRMPDSFTLNGDASKWTPRHLLADWLPHDRNMPFATVYAGWNDDGIYFSVQANLRREPRPKPARFTEGDCFEVFVDTRGTLGSAFTEHCSHFFFLPPGGGSRSATSGMCEPGVATQAASLPPDVLRVRGESYAQGYRLEIGVTRAAMPTYDPIAYPRLGFNYILHDAAGRTQWWASGKEIETHRDPSTWGILELTHS